MARVESQGITAIDPVAPCPLSVLPGPSTETISSDHSAVKRYFIGPLPISIASAQLRRSRRIFRALTRGNPHNDVDAELDDMSEEHIWHIILQRSGWESNMSLDARHALVRKLKANPWFTLALGNKKNFRTKWIGDSFEVGKDLLGANILVSGSSGASSKASASRKPPLQPKSSSTPALSTQVKSGDPTSSYHTAASKLPPDALTTSHIQPQLPLPESYGRNSDSESQPAKSNSSLLPHRKQGSPGDSRTIAGVENTPLVHRPKTAMLRSAFRQVVSPDIHPKPRTVNFVGDGDNNSRAVEQGLSPAPPVAVLSRRHSHGELVQTSAGAVAQHVERSSVVMQDRMLVKLSHSPSGNLPVPFGEDEARHHPHLREQEWREYLVLWSGRNLDLYKNYALQRKHPAYTISLGRSTTRLSLYSHSDMSFCLTYNPTPSNSPSPPPIFHRTFAGTNVFVFKCKARSRGVDWMWLLWRELGGEIPSTLDVQVPVLGTRVILDLPQHDVLDGGEGHKPLSQQHIVNVCRDALSSLPEYASLMDTEMEHGASLGLAWRRQMQLDWVWLDHDVSGAPRDWSTLFGLAFKQGHVPVQLELRVASHSLTKARLADGADLVEPSSIEGYLYRIKPATQTRSNIYVASHGGNLFTMTPAHAFPPPVPQPPEEFINQPGDKNPILTREREITRGAEQILRATGYVDIRDISVVRRASETLAPQSYPALAEGEASENFLQLPDDSDLLDMSEDNDPGGEEFLIQSTERANVKLKRSFELVMRTGAVMRFEAHKTSNALEWIKHLRALVRFWMRRHRVDARVEMDLVHLSTGKPRFEVPRASVSHSQGHHVPSALPNPQAAAHSLSSFWTWCVLDVCGPVVKAGLLYAKYGPRKHFQHMCMVLIPGHIVLFHASLSKAGHHHHARTISLIDSYVYSGLLAASDLPMLFDTTVPRRYKDGLETNDADLDTTFVIRHRSQPSGWHKMDADDEKPITPKAASAAVPSLNSKHQLLIFKARSKLERDAWCWALNAEIERVVRATADREERLRSGGS